MNFNLYKYFYNHIKKKISDKYIDYTYAKIIFSSKFKKTTYLLNDKRILDIYQSLKTKGIINYNIDYITESLMEPYIRICKEKALNYHSKQNPTDILEFVKKKL